MSIFVRKDPRLLACADPSWPGAVWRMLRRHACAAGIVLTLAGLSYAANVVLGLRAAAQTGGTIGGLALDGPATIARDARGIPHIRASTLHDLFFAQGFAQASDRLFEMDVTRRYAYGRLAEVFGAKALSIDEYQRAANIGGIAEREWRHADARTRAVLQAFSDGVNAAEKHQPLPVEFRMLLYRPQTWKPQDSIAVSLVAALELGDSWYDVIARDERWRALGARCFAQAFPLSDPHYDVSLQGRRMRAPDAHPAAACAGKDLAFHGATRAAPRLGSNAWAAGAALTSTHRALVANDPHVDLTIPGIWYAVDLRAPGFHVAGAVVPGLPGVVLGHNERIAWAVTNAQVATSVVYRPVSPPPKDERVVEIFHVRFAPAVRKAYYRTRDAFSLPADEDGTAYFVRWPPYVQTSSTIPVLLALDRARSISAAMRALSRYRGSPQNFVVAGPGGRIAYHLAGALYDDPAWGRYVHRMRDMARPLRLIPFEKLPAAAPSEKSVLLSANNRMYGAGYPYRLSAQFEPPYRAYRIAELLHARKKYDVRYFERMQMDACSPVDAEVARRIDQAARSRTFARWDGCFGAASRRASLEHSVRDTLLEQSGSLALLLADLRAPVHAARDGIGENAAASLFARERPQTWGRAGEVDVEHPLSAAWYGMLRGTTLPGDGDEYTIHLQEPGFAQGFRAVWQVGDWDAGGIALPSGESGEPGSGHYDDLAKAWIRGEMQPLAFSARAVSRATVTTLVLRAATRARRPAQRPVR